MSNASKLVIIAVLFAVSVSLPLSAARVGKGAASKNAGRVIDTTKFNEAERIEVKADGDTRLIIISDTDQVRITDDGTIIITRPGPGNVAASTVTKKFEPPDLPLINKCKCQGNYLMVVMDTNATDLNLEDTNKCLIITGNENDNTIRGGKLSNIIYGRGGHDTIFGGDCNDQITGNDGTDTIYGKGEADTVYSTDNDNFADKNTEEGDKYMNMEME